MARVLVTGGSGFIGSHALLQLLGQDHDVRTTVRSLRGEAKVRAALAAADLKRDRALTFVEADLEKDEGWSEAVADCDFVLHVASPFPPSQPSKEDELIVPAREGTLRLLRAARDAGVRRVVLTSSFAAVGYGHAPRETPFDETDWTDIGGPGVAPYAKSKTLAERSAWDFMEREGGDLELAVVNPVSVLGPVLGPDYSTSIIMIQRLLDGEMPGLPNLWFGVVDVRDVVDLHIRAMKDAAAKGERFLAVSGAFMSIGEMARTLRERLGDAAKRVPTRKVPNWLVRLSAISDAEVRLVVPELGTRKEASSDKAQKRLGWSPISREETLVATAQSLIDQKLLKSQS